MTLLIADLNEYRPLIDAHTYANWSPAIILRAHNGYREDHTYPQSVALVHAEPGIRAVGHYGYVVAGIDAAQQGHDFATIVNTRGGLRPGHFIACDLEEGSGDQAPRMEAWLTAAAVVLHEPAAAEFGYSGAAFWQAHLWSVNNVHRWIAAYGQPAPPTLGQTLWQFTDRQPVPGVSGPADCSTFNGSIDQLLAIINPPAPPPEDHMGLYIFAPTTTGDPAFVSIDGLLVKLPDTQTTAEWEQMGAKIVAADHAFIQQLNAKAN